MTRGSGLVLAFMLALGACSPHDGHGHYHDDDDDDDYENLTDCESGVLVAEIDRGGYLELDPGLGAGVTVEYAGDGFWRVAATCDTEYSGLDCLWDLELTPLGAELFVLEPEGLESNDSLQRFFQVSGDETVSFVSLTASELDAITLETIPGAPLRVDALLDDGCGGPYVSWIERAVVVGSSTQVTELYPVEP